MKALRIREGSLAATELPLPTLGSHDVLVDVVAVAMSARDIALAARSDVIPGRHFAGTIAAVGSAVIGLNVGDTVVAAPPGPCGACGACLRGDDAYCARIESLYAGIRPGVDADGGLAQQVRVADIFLAPAPGLDLAVATLACDLGVQALHAIRAAGDAMTIGNRAIVVGTSPLATYTRELLQTVTGVEIVEVDDVSPEAAQRVVEQYAPDGIATTLVMDRSQAACDFATAVTTIGGAVVLASNGDGVATVQPMPLMRYEVSVREVVDGNRRDLVELLRLLKFRTLDVAHERVCVDEFASFDADRLNSLQPGLVVVL